MSWKIITFIYHFPYSKSFAHYVLHCTSNATTEEFSSGRQSSVELCAIFWMTLYLSSLFTAPTNNENSRKTHELQGINEAEFCRSFISGWGLGRPPRGCLLPSGRHTRLPHQLWCGGVRCVLWTLLFLPCCWKQYPQLLVYFIVGGEIFIADLLLPWMLRMQCQYQQTKI